jgi:hypothetical protein
MAVEMRPLAAMAVRAETNNANAAVSPITVLRDPQVHQEHPERREKMVRQEKPAETEPRESQASWRTPTLADASNAKPDPLVPQDPTDLPDKPDQLATPVNLEIPEKPDRLDHQDLPEMLELQAHPETKDQLEHPAKKAKRLCLASPDQRDQPDHQDHQERQEKLEPLHLQDNQAQLDLLALPDHLDSPEKTENPALLAPWEFPDRMPPTALAHLVPPPPTWLVREQLAVIAFAASNPSSFFSQMAFPRIPLRAFPLQSS